MAVMGVESKLRLAIVMLLALLTGWHQVANNFDGQMFAECIDWYRRRER